MPTNNAAHGARLSPSESIGPSARNGQTGERQPLTALVRTWLRRCPALEQDRRFGADYLGDEEGYSLDAVPTALGYRENILGDMVLREKQEQNFVFAAREPYGADCRQNLENLALMQAVSGWIIERNDARDFPGWEGGEVVAIVPTLSGYPIAMGSAFARYQIQIKVTYRVTGIRE